MTALLIILVLLVVVIAVGVGIYNRLVQLRNRYQNAFSQIDVQLKRRYDLIPNLVETARGYMKHERETLEAVVKARDRASAASQKAAESPGDPGSIQGLMGAETALAGALRRLYVVVEAYPDLKADQRMGQLMEELTTTENKVAFARQAYNDSVMSYNTSCQTFPNFIIANAMGFREAQLFEIEAPEEREAPKVSFT